MYGFAVVGQTWIHQLLKKTDDFNKCIRDAQTISYIINNDMIDRLLQSQLKHEFTSITAHPHLFDFICAGDELPAHAQASE